MRFIEEIVVDEFLPTVRSMLAEALRERGFTQHEVAEALEISQSAVSKYAHGEVSRREELLNDDRLRDLVERVAEGLAEGDMSPVAALVEFEVFIRELEDDDLLADLHEEAMPALAGTEYSFAVHDPESTLRDRERTLASLRRGLRTLANASGFAGLIPHVGSNLVECLPDATDIDEVAGVPGRIFDVKGRATVPNDPEFGMSEHVAGVLLSARAAGATVRAAVNITHDADIVATLESAGYECIPFDPDAPTDAVEAALSDWNLDDRDRPAPFVLYQTGGFGIEPVVYVLGPDAPAVAEVVRELV